MSASIDFYSVLGVDRRARPSEIRDAYKRLAVALHPDRNLTEADALEHFKVVQQAFSVLSDPQRRVEYDAKRRSWLDDGHPDRTPAIPHPRTPQKGCRIEQTVQVPKTVLRDGGRVIVTVARTVPCAQCAGQGCATCSGSGVQRVNARLGVPVPPSTPAGARMRVPGRGHAGRWGGEDGDLILTLQGGAA